MANRWVYRRPPLGRTGPPSFVIRPPTVVTKTAVYPRRSPPQSRPSHHVIRAKGFVPTFNVIAPPVLARVRVAPLWFYRPKVHHPRPEITLPNESVVPDTTFVAPRHRPASWLFRSKTHQVPRVVIPPVVIPTPPVDSPVLARRYIPPMWMYTRRHDYTGHKNIQWPLEQYVPPLAEGIPTRRYVPALWFYYPKPFWKVERLSYPPLNVPSTPVTEESETPPVLFSEQAASSLGLQLDTNKLRFTKPLLNRNLSALRRDTPEETVESLVKHFEEVHRFLDMLYERDMAAVRLSDDGLPAHGEFCRALQGQYVRLTSTGPGSIIPVAHGLGRVPQGVLWVWSESTQHVIIKRDDDNNISAATNRIVYFIMDGEVGTEAVGVLF